MAKTTKLQGNSEEQKKSKSNSEIGHAKNYQNFGVLTSRIQGYGPRYNPSNPAIKQPALQTIFSNSGTFMLSVDTTGAAYMLAVDNRQQSFTDMEKLATRIINALASSTGVTKAMIEDAKTFIRKIRGERKSKLITAEPNQAANTTTPETKVLPLPVQISASQQSYDQQIEHFTKLISLVAAVASYTPNETELQNASLTTYLTSLKNINAAVVAATTPF